MTDFTREILSEIRPPENDCCRLAFLSAAVRTSAVLEASGREKKLVFPRAAAELTDKLNECLVPMFGAKLEKGEIADGVARILGELGILRRTGEGIEIVRGIDRHLVMGDCCKAAYVSGAFMGCGGLTVSPGNNRLRFSVNLVEQAEDLSALLGHFGVSSFLSEHKERYDVYVKRRQSISDCLVLMGAQKAMLRFSSEAALREARAEINRVTNIEVANIGKTVDAGVRQIEAVKRIAEADGLDALEEKLRETALLRLESEYLTYEEMARRLGVSKGSVKYRLKKLVELGEKYFRDGKDN